MLFRSVRMTTRVNLLQPLRLHVRIDLRRADTDVPEQFLHHAQVSPTFQKMGCKTMPKGVRTDLPWDPPSYRLAPDEPPDGRPIHPTAIATEE